MSTQLETRFASPSATTNFAVALGARLQPGDVILLEGGIGAGKTHLARSLIQSLLPQPEDVPSPTFTLVQVYDGPECEIWHADLYRLTDPNEAIELGLEDAFNDAICLIEWPDRLSDLAPKDALRLELSALDESSRTMIARWHDAKWADRLKGLL